MTEPRVCAACGAAEPRCGLSLTDDLDRWICRGVCTGTAIEPAELGNQGYVLPEVVAAAIDADYEARRARR